MLLAMATGTGKAITCIGLVYRLIKARRFCRVLFLVDRATLDRGQFQAEGGFARLDKVFDGKLEQLLAEINEAVWQDAG